MRSSIESQNLAAIAAPFSRSIAFTYESRNTCLSYAIQHWRVLNIISSVNGCFATRSASESPSAAPILELFFFFWIGWATGGASTLISWFIFSEARKSMYTPSIISDRDALGSFALHCSIEASNLLQIVQTASDWPCPKRASGVWFLMSSFFSSAGAFTEGTDQWM
jgi:hypothetical protein